MQIKDFKFLLDTIDDLDNNALIVFDVDDTLIVAKDKILCSCGEKALKSLTLQWGEKLSFEKQIALQSLVLLQRKITHTDPLLKSIFLKLQEKKIPSMALTAMPTGKFGHIDSLEQWREKELQHHGIDFSKHPPFRSNISLTEFENEVPLYYNGMLFSHNYPKGDILRSFLVKTEIRPSQVIFVDDRDHHVFSVNEAMKTLSIPCQSFHYVGATYSADELSETIVQYQFRHLLEKERWLPDDEVKNRLFS